jgi:aminopeptidase N
MRWLGLTIALAVGACGGSDEPEPPVGDMVFDVEHYDYAFDLDSRAASVRLTVNVEADGNCLTLPFRATDLGGQPTLDGELAVSGTLDGGQLTLCGAGWVAGTQIIVEVAMTVPEETWGSLDVGYSVNTDIEGNPFSYMVSWVGGCDRFGPCDNDADKFAYYRFTVAHPSGTTVLCPGRITPGDTQTVCEFDYAGGPTYSTFGIAASPSWETTEVGTWEGVTVTVYDMPSNGAIDELDTDAIASFLSFMVDNFGPYPYGDEMRIAYGPTAWQGFEHPGNILMYDRIHTSIGGGRADAMRHTINHEIAHMWAGDQTTLADTYDFVWKEAVVEYLSSIWESEEHGDLTAPAYWKSIGPRSDWYPVPAERPELNVYYGDVYGLGPMILFRQIEGLYDRDTVMTALRSLLGTPRALRVADIQAALEDATGADLENYFDTWVYGEGVPSVPVFDVLITDQGKGDYDLRVTQQGGDVQLYGMAFTLQLTGDNDETFDVRIDLGVDGMPTYFTTAAPGFVVTGHELDPYNESFAFDAAALAAAMARDDLAHPMLAPIAPQRYE